MLIGPCAGNSDANRSIARVRGSDAEPGGSIKILDNIGDLPAFKAQFFRALAHPTRIRILEILTREGRTVQELQEALTLDQPIVSQQLAVLRNQSIVSAARSARAAGIARMPAVSG